MKLIVTGSIAYDYLMSFPGKFTEHFLAEHMQRVSLSFLVDSMDKRRGGCAPNIAYTLALLGETPRLMGTAGQDFDDYRRWLEAAGVDTSLVAQVPDKPADPAPTNPAGAVAGPAGRFGPTPRTDDHIVGFDGAEASAGRTAARRLTTVA